MAIKDILTHIRIISGNDSWQVGDIVSDSFNITDELGFFNDKCNFSITFNKMNSEENPLKIFTPDDMPDNISVQVTAEYYFYVFVVKNYSFQINDDYITINMNCVRPTLLQNPDNFYNTQVAAIGALFNYRDFSFNRNQRQGIGGLDTIPLVRDIQAIAHIRRLIDNVDSIGDIVKHMSDYGFGYFDGGGRDWIGDLTRYHPYFYPYRALYISTFQETVARSKDEPYDITWESPVAWVYLDDNFKTKELSNAINYEIKDNRIRQNYSGIGLLGKLITEQKYTSLKKEEWYDIRDRKFDLDDLNDSTTLSKIVGDLPQKIIKEDFQNRESLNARLNGETEKVRFNSVVVTTKEPLDTSIKPLTVASKQLDNTGIPNDFVIFKLNHDIVNKTTEIFMHPVVGSSSN